jgi:1-deoxy-D-xylulose-5-phosphate reductoisomerase
MTGTIKRIAILGSTGSIGRQTLDVVRNLPSCFNVVALAAGQNLDLLKQQIDEFRPSYVYCEAEEVLSDVGTGYEPLSLEEIASHEQIDTVVIATSGKSGLLATLTAVQAGKNIALANKESMVMAGEIITSEARASGASILPVDSEHSAIWQCLQGEAQSFARIILTASGGPFRSYSVEQLEQVTAAQALEHPSWQMGPKITIDSATLMNKGLEIIEAHWLFNSPFEDIRIIIHPQSIIHSMIEFTDGSVKAQLGCPDMRLPIQYALTHPERLPNPELPRIDWDKITELTFEQPDVEKFPCLKLAIEAGKKGSTYPSVLCAADEIAVDLFLSGAIKFTDIARLVEQTLDRHKAVANPSLKDILAADDWARQAVGRLAKEIARC